jgi:hypothetical protein
MKARLALLAAMSAVVGLSACKDPTNLEASFPTSVDTLSVFALSGTPPTYPSAISILIGQPVRVDGGANFDIAFDINTAGKPVIYPVKLVVNLGGSSRPVGLLRVPGIFDSVLVAPKTGYEPDSGLVMAFGEVVAVQSAHNINNGDLCQFAINPNLYAKVAVDSVDLVSRTIFLRLGFDPNCGFRSFVSGIPTD